MFYFVSSWFVFKYWFGIFYSILVEVIVGVGLEGFFGDVSMYFGMFYLI